MRMRLKDLFVLMNAIIFIAEMLLLYLNAYQV